MNTGTAGRTFPVFVQGWILDDRSLAPPACGDVIDVILSFVPAAVAPMPGRCALRGTARPAYGRTPVDGGGGLHWLMEVSGDRWAARWWSPRPVAGPVELDGSFVVDLADGRDDPPSVRGRVRRVRVVRQRLERTATGTRAVPGTEWFTAVTATPRRFWSDWSAATDGEPWVDTGVLVDLDLDDVPVAESEFMPGSVATHDTDVWVMHRADPVLLHVDTTGIPPRVTEYLLPLTMEISHGGYATRAVHADAGGCWITSGHDVFRCDRTGAASVTVERVCAEGGRSVLDGGRVYLLRATGPRMCADRRYGPIRVEGDAHRVRVLGDDRRLTVVADRATVDRVTATVARMRGGGRGEWTAGGALVVRDPDGEPCPVDLEVRVEGSVRWVQPDPYADPANAGLVPILRVPLSDR
ncbi:DUF6578 domain-containing protein [Rhodococcus sp. Q]|uniref:DUF6578 domain-containing protein n=1 Tax=Rhodococcus sp. Q TaxID=2502252 RepID=UPI0010F5045F|nr:DUF6578 domain-containing protein [Rhodococcus sp. Q]